MSALTPMNGRRKAISFALLALAAKSVEAAAIDKKVFMSRVSGGQRIFNKEGSYCTEYNISGANYRTWWPMSAPWGNAGGIVTNFKVDHIRGGAEDDHAFLELFYNQLGGLNWCRYSVSYGGNFVINSAVVAGLASALGGPTAAVYAKVGTEVANAAASYAWRDRSGGRRNFGAIVNRNIQWASASII